MAPQEEMVQVVVLVIVVQRNNRCLLKKLERAKRKVENKTYERMIRVVGKAMGRTKWWVCFGNVLHLVRDNNVKNDKDMDIGIFYEDMDLALLERSFNKWGFRLKQRIINDVDGKCFYACFKSNDYPPLDVFAWYKWGKYRFHTYDTMFEKNSVPSKYVFKGIEDRLMPTLGVRNLQDPNIFMSHFGTKDDILSFDKIPVPMSYGACLDRWYPDWLTPRAIE